MLQFFYFSFLFHFNISDENSIYLILGSILLLKRTKIATYEKDIKSFGTFIAESIVKKYLLNVELKILEFDTMYENELWIIVELL